ncbi:MAG: cbb3-type cytochrome oxidase assembly protein CcoS [Flavobacteriaceae bacterium]|jgi:cbb3-type cytochrome oxidase maturation protein|nr:cbb3-type cytochrome oxidase assembly protein CcoS [Flavobacteriaceae bacterium]
MEILYLMILCSVSLAIVFLALFIYGMKKGQFDDDESPAVRILFDSNEEFPKEESEKIEDNNKVTT